MRFLRRGLRRGGPDDAGGEEPPCANAACQAVHGTVTRVGIQRVDQGAEREARRSGVADVVGCTLPLRSTLRGKAFHAVLRYGPAPGPPARLTRQNRVVVVLAHVEVPGAGRSNDG